jgi:hypothetical protein
MNETHETKKYSAGRIALLGLFILALLIAYFITRSRSAVVLSGPIKLNGSGLSVSLPSGNGWQSEKQWKYQDNGFTLSSVFVIGSGGLPPQAHCRYLLAADSNAPAKRFKQKASAIEGVLAQTGQIQTGTITLDWAHIKKPGFALDIFLGTARLPNDRQLDIEAYQATGETNIAERAFKRIAENAKFEGNQPLNAGIEIVTEIKNTGLDRLLHNRSQESFFFIKDVAAKQDKRPLSSPANKQPIGFSIDVLVDLGREAELNIQASSFFYIRGQYTREMAAFFKCDNNLEHFNWKSETSDPLGRSGTEIILDKTSVMTVRKFDAQAQEKNYNISPAAIPVLFLEQLLGRTLDRRIEKIIVDIIEADGTVTPMLVSRLEDTAAAEENAAYAIKTELLNGRGFYELLYLDEKNQVLKGLLHYENTYLAERTSIENVLKEFPEQADFIRQKNKFPE